MKPSGFAFGCLQSSGLVIVEWMPTSVIVEWNIACQEAQEAPLDLRPYSSRTVRKLCLARSEHRNTGPVTNLTFSQQGALIKRSRCHTPAHPIHWEIRGEKQVKCFATNNAWTCYTCQAFSQVVASHESWLIGCSTLAWLSSVCRTFLSVLPVTSIFVSLSICNFVTLLTLHVVIWSHTACGNLIPNLWLVFQCQLFTLPIIRFLVCNVTLPTIRVTWPCQLFDSSYVTWPLLTIWRQAHLVYGWPCHLPPSNSIGLESFKYIKSIESDNPSFHGHNNFHPLVVVLGVRSTPRLFVMCPLAISNAVLLNILWRRP